MYQDRLRSIFAAVVKMPEARVRVNAHVMDELGADSLQRWIAAEFPELEVARLARGKGFHVIEAFRPAE